MPEGFKVGAAYIEVDADADVAIKKIIGQLKAAKPRIERIADEIGQSAGRKLGSGMEKQLRATKGRLSVLATDIGNTVGSRVAGTMNKQLRDAKGRLGNTADGLGTEIGKRVSSSMTKTIKIGDGLTAGAGAAGKRIGKELGDGIDDGAASQISKSPRTKKALDSVAERANAQFKGLIFAGAFAGLPAAAGVAAAGTVAALAAVPIGLVAAAAAVQAGNEKLADSYVRLGDTAMGVLQRASSVLVDDLVQGTDRLEAETRQLEPVLTGAFRAAAPAVDGLVTSLITATDEALPGVITGLTKTEDAMRGVQALSKGAGRGVSDFFANVSTGSQAAATNAGTLGRIVHDLGGFLGSLVANLNNAGTGVLPMFANALSIAYGAVLNLTGSGVGPLVSGVSSFIAVTSGALSVVNALTGGIGGLLGPLTAMYGGFKALDLISGGKFGDKLGAEFTGLGDRIRNADGVRGKFQAGMSGLVAGAFSPVGLAAGALTIGLGVLGAAHQKAAADAAAQKAREADLAAALRESKGVLDASVRSQAAKSLGEMQLTNTGKNYLQVARELGISQSDLTSAYLGNAGATEKIKTALTALTKASSEYVSDESGVREEWSGQGAVANDLLEAMGGLNGEYNTAVQKNRDLAAAASSTTDAVSEMTPALAASRQGTAELAAAFTTLYNPVSSVTDKANALITVLDRLAGRTPSYEESIQSVNDTLRAMADSLASGGNQADGWGAALLRADGTVNTLTKNGSELQNNLVTLQSGFANAGASIDALVRGGMTYQAAAQKVNGELTVQRNRFVDLATTMLGSRKAAEDLADTYGLLPDKVVTTVTDYGSAIKTDSDVGSLFLRLRELPPNTSVRVTSITAEAEQRLRDLGYTVTHMPDGTVLIVAKTEQAQKDIGAVQSGINALKDKTVTITTRYTQIGTPAPTPRGTYEAQLATGGPSRPVNYSNLRTRASGGPTPVLAGLANARLVGERGPEIDFPSRSTYVATAQQTQRMARDVSAGTRSMREAIEQLVMTATPAAAQSGPSITVNVYPAPSMDENALVAKFNRVLARVLKGGQS